MGVWRRRIVRLRSIKQQATWKEIARRFRRPIPAYPWYDRHDADQRLARGLPGARPGDHELLENWRRDGFLQLPGVVPEAAIDQLRADIDGAWDKNDPRIWVEHYSSEEVMVDPLQGDWREEPHKLLDVHCSSQAARKVLASPELERWLHLLLGPKVFAFQSLVFKRGTMQGMHRDTNFVGVEPAWQMIALWIALEDIQPGTGELEYFVGSHRLEDYTFPSGAHYLLPEETLPQGYSESYEALAAKRGLERQSFLPKRGDVLIWHAGLVHGGRDNISPGSTRRSFVVHLAPRGGVPYYARNGEWGPCHTVAPGLAAGSAWRDERDGPIDYLGPRFPHK